jgi:hypothetical protein
MKRVLGLLVGLFAVLAPAAARADVSLGANFGAAFVIPESGPSHVGIGWPYSSLLTLPGLRVGFELSGDKKHELYLDSTFWAQGSRPFRTGILLVAYQHNFNPNESNTFYFTAGGGPIWYSAPNTGEFTLMAGGGVGMRQKVSGGHGTIREELRGDFVMDTDYFERKFLISAKFGFDLWFR